MLALAASDSMAHDKPGMGLAIGLVEFVGVALLTVPGYILPGMLYVDLHRWQRRRVHDTRRTFISLARGDGALKERLKWATHGADGDIMDLYTEPPWEMLCAEVAKLNIRLRGEATVAELPIAYPAVCVAASA